LVGGVHQALLVLRFAFVALAACNLDSKLPDVSPDSALPDCDPTAPFGTPTRVPGLPTTFEVWLSPDEKTIYFNAPGSVGGDDLFVATRSERTKDFEPPTLLANVNSTVNDGGIIVSDNQLMGFIITNRPDGANASRDVYVTTRNSPLAEFGTPERLANVNDNDPAVADFPTWISGDATLLYITTRRNGESSGFQIVHTRSVGGVFGPPVPQAEINAVANSVAAAVLTVDQRTIYFANEDVGRIFVASRSSPDDGFGAASEVGELDVVGGSFQYPMWVSPDECRLYFGSDDGTHLAVRGQ
jgi:hypothetical protein